MIAKAEERAASATKAAGKRWGMPGLNLEHVAKIRSMGATFIASATDIIVLKEGLKSIQKQYSELGFTFDSRLGDGVKAL